MQSPRARRSTLRLSVWVAVVVWLVLWEIHAVLLPDLDAGPLFSRFAHDAVLLIATGFDKRSSERPVAAFAAGGKQREGGFLRRPKPAEQEDTGEFSMPPTDPLEIPSFLREE